MINKIQWNLSVFIICHVHTHTLCLWIYRGTFPMMHNHFTLHCLLIFTPLTEWTRNSFIPFIVTDYNVISKKRWTATAHCKNDFCSTTHKHQVLSCLLNTCVTVDLFYILLCVHICNLICNTITLTGICHLILIWTWLEGLLILYRGYLDKGVCHSKKWRLLPWHWHFHLMKKLTDIWRTTHVLGDEIFNSPSDRKSVV